MPEIINTSLSFSNTSNKLIYNAEDNKNNISISKSELKSPDQTVIKRKRFNTNDLLLNCETHNSEQKGSDFKNKHRTNKFS